MLINRKLGKRQTEMQVENYKTSSIKNNTITIVLGYINKKQFYSVKIVTNL